MYADSNEFKQNRLRWLEILEMLWSVMRLIFKTSSVTPDFFYIFNIILSFSTWSQSLKKICRWEILGASVLNRRQNQIISTVISRTSAEVFVGTTCDRELQKI